MRQELREYQAKAAAEVHRAMEEGISSVLVVAPTGAGKTSLAAHLIHEAVSKGERVIFLAHRKELIDQCSARLDGQDIPHGIIKAGNRRVNQTPVQVASVQTLVNRIEPDPTSLVPRQYLADLIIIDEAHRAGADTYRRVLASFPKAKCLGLTATPYRSDGKGLGDLFQTIVQVSSPGELTELGYLVPARVFTTPLVPDFSKIRTKMGEFDKQSMERAMDKASLIGDIYGQWKRLAPERKTVIFATSLKHARHIVEAFQGYGEAIAYLDGETPEEERNRILAALASGEIQIVVNVGILTEGWDCPAVSCVVLARPTKSCGLYLQMAGRALRTAEGKSDCIIIDHGGNTIRHGLVADDRQFDLEGEKGGGTGARLITCFMCHRVHEFRACPHCGHVNKKPKHGDDDAPPEDGEKVESIDADLEEIDHAKLRARRNEEIAFFRQCLELQLNRGFKYSYASVTFKDRYGRWPDKQIGYKPIWGANYGGGKPKGFVFQGIEVYADAPLASFT